MPGTKKKNEENENEIDFSRKKKLLRFSSSMAIVFKKIGLQ